MFSRVLVLAVFLLAAPISAGAQDFRADDMSEGETEATGAVTFEFYAQASVGRVAPGQAFTLEISAIQKWGDAPELLTLDIPGIEAFRVVSEKEDTRDFKDFRGEPTYDTTYLLELAPTATGSYTLGPVTASTPEGQLMSSDPIRIEVAAASAVAPDGVARPARSGAGEESVAIPANPLWTALAVLGTFVVLLIALYFALALSARSRSASLPTGPVALSTDGAMPDLPHSVVGERELFELLRVRYGRDVRSLTTREIVALESDPEDRMWVASLLDPIRASRYADRQP